MSTELAIFSRLANSSARYLGSGTAFGIAIGMVPLWAIAGAVFKLSDSWELMINTVTTIITFSHGVFDSEYAKPGHCCDPIEAQ